MSRPWYRLPLPLSLVKLSQFRKRLRRENLHDTSPQAIPDGDRLPQPQPDPEERHLRARTVDGSYNDLGQPQMGMAGTRFGRNVPLAAAKLDTDRLLEPNPRMVSETLLGRAEGEFHPATSLNLLAAAWIQFQNHDWFSHGKNVPENPIEVPLAEGDDWPQDRRPMRVQRTAPDPTRTGGTDSTTPTFINEVTHWWDGSQLYGSDLETLARLRSGTDGKMLLDAGGELLPLDAQKGVDLTGFNENWWVGLSLLHSLFVQEHNAICDGLKQEYPRWSDDDLFDKARLINAALMAKIHTVEWTPGILATPALENAMNINWWGLLGQSFKEAIGRLGDSEVLSGIMGSPTDHHAAPFYLTEEFVSVYRLHPLIPDELEFYSLEDSQSLGKKSFLEAFGTKTRPLMETISVPDLLYSFGLMHPGAITLHNYPQTLRRLQRESYEGGEFIDLAAIDILRDRERGVPRYNEFRELIGRGRAQSFEEITSNPAWAQELREVYGNDIERIDLMVGMFAEDLPPGFGFSDTAFRIFILMASRRLKSDRFFTTDYTPEVYTPFGYNWVENTTMSQVLLRHYPELRRALNGVQNPFAPWRKIHA